MSAKASDPSEDLIRSKHVAIWIDHKEARVFHVSANESDEATVAAPQRMHHRHPQGAQGSKAHPDDAKRFFHEVSRSLEGAEAILIVGPSTAKLEYLRYLHEHDRAIERCVVAIETVDHPSDGQLVAYAKRYFKLSDRIQ